MDHYDDKAKQDALVDGSSVDSTLEDDRILQEIGYVPSFKREFSNLATVRPLFPPGDVFADKPDRQISFAFSIMGLCSSIATTFNTPLLLGGPSTVTWCWILGACMCFTLGAFSAHPRRFSS